MTDRPGRGRDPQSSRHWSARTDDGKDGTGAGVGLWSAKLVTREGPLAIEYTNAVNPAIARTSSAVLCSTNRLRS